MRAPRRWRIGVGAALAIVVAALGGTVAFGVLSSAASSAERTLAVTPAVTAAELYVHVSGAVNAPGLYLLPASARVVDAVAAAGGLAADADRDAVNLARPVTDGEQVVVPRVGEASATEASGGDERIDLNSATAEELDTLPRIGPALAERIIAWRDENGRFATVEDLLSVSGIGEKMMSAIRPLVRV